MVSQARDADTSEQINRLDKGKYPKIIIPERYNAGAEERLANTVCRYENEIFPFLRHLKEQ